MPLQQYFGELKYYKIDSIPDLFAIQHPHDSGSSYFFATYNHYRNRKKKLFDLMEKLGQREFKRQWDGHHVVEGNHLKSFFQTQHKFETFYNAVWPVVYIQNDEHKMYNSLFRSKERSMLFNLTRGVSKQERYENVKALYTICYDGNSVLKTVSQHVLLEIKNLLPTLV